MRNNDYYQVLGLKPTCTPHDIKKSYRQLALIWHPDKHNNKKEAQAKFTSINEAYNILIDANKRQIYDEYGPDGLGSDNMNKKNNFFDKGFCGTDKSAFDVLRDIFQDNDDESEDFFKDFNLSGMRNTMKANVQSFVFEHIILSEEENENEDEENNFFANYMPTFMNTAFTSTLSSLTQLYSTEGNSAGFFSSFFTEPSQSESGPNPAKKMSRKGKVTQIITEDDNEYETLSQKKSSKSSHPSNTRKTTASKAPKTLFEEEFLIEVNLTNKRRKLSFSLEIVSGSNHGTPKRKSAQNKSSKTKEGGRKKIKK